MKKISVLIPCYNEEKTLPLLYPELVKLMEGLPDYEWEIMFVNDGSADNTLHILQQLRQQDKRVNYVDLSRNFGKEVAMLAGFDYVTGDCMVIVDADLQDPPALIPEMLKYWEEGYEDVYARRRTRGKESWLRKWLSIKFYKLLQRTSRFDVLQNVGDFRLLDRRCINALKRMRESERYTKGMFCWIGFNKKEVEFDRGDRVAGHSSWGYKQLFSLAIDGITSFTSAPLRISTFVGFVVSMLAFIYMIYVFIKALIWGDPVQGYPSMVILILFLGGIQLLSLGIIGEYIGRIYNETKNRPDYIVREFNGFPDMGDEHKD
ncbi:MAG: glycosyltransferase family 2 protein [Muribaculaceae bacterium]|nr:glycosyltransferase family 2 protein [Muribaculaceae bacterium]